MKRILIVLIVACVPALASAQVKTNVTAGSALPPTCTAPTDKKAEEFVLNTDTPPALYLCTATNTWTKIGSGGAGTVTTTGSPVSTDCAFFSGSTTITGDATCTWDGTMFGLGAAGTTAITLTPLSYGYLFHSPGHDYTEMDQYVDSDGFAEADYNGWMISRTGDRLPGPGGAVQPAGTGIELGWVGWSYNDTTVATSLVGYFKVAGADVNVMAGNSSGDIGLVVSTAMGNETPTALNSNLFVAGDGSGTAVKGNLTVVGLKCPSGQHSPVTVDDAGKLIAASCS